MLGSSAQKPTPPISRITTHSASEYKSPRRMRWWRFSRWSAHALILARAASDNGLHERSQRTTPPPLHRPHPRRGARRPRPAWACGATGGWPRSTASKTACTRCTWSRPSKATSRWWPSFTGLSAGATRRSPRSTPLPKPWWPPKSRPCRRCGSRGKPCTTLAVSPSPSAPAAAAGAPSWKTSRCWSGSAASWHASTPWARNKPFVTRPALNATNFAHEPRDWLLEHHMVAPEVQTAWRETLAEALAIIESHPCLTAQRASRIPRAFKPCGCTATATPATSSGRPRARPAPARTLSTSTTPAWARPCKTSGCCSAANAASKTSNSAR